MKSKTPRIDTSSESRSADSGLLGNPATDVEELSENVAYDFGVSRRGFVQVLGAGIMLAVNAGPALAQRAGGRGGGGGGRTRPVAARIHIGKDGIITVMAGKVEM